MKKILEFKNFNYQYNKNCGFENFSMDIFKGQIVSLVGPSGSGKTTLLNCICHKFPNNSMYLNEKNINEYETTDKKRKIVVVFDHKFNKITIEDELMYYFNHLNYSKDEIRERVNIVLEYFSLNDFINKNINELSYSKQSLIKILRYLVLQPEFIAIDGLFGTLIESDKKKLIKFIRENDITLLNVVYDLNDTLYSDYIFVMDNFEIILEGGVKSVLKTDTILKRLGFSLPLSIDLSIELMHYGVLKNIVSDNERLVNEIWK